MSAKAIGTLTLISIGMISCSKDDSAISEPLAYPSFGSEIDVDIIGLSFDAMEPFVSPDGNYLFFNNINDGIDTKLFYATRVNDSTFVFTVELAGINQVTPPYLDAVADMDLAVIFTGYQQEIILRNWTIFFTELLVPEM